MRKEKLGERIVALQQLVSPFGKVVFFYFGCVKKIEFLTISAIEIVSFFNFIFFIMIFADRYSFSST